MSRERFEEVQAQVNRDIKRHDERLAELQGVITTSGSIIATQQALMDKATEENDPEAYTQAQTLYNMHRSRKYKAEQEQGRLSLDPVLPLAKYNEIASFLRWEGENNATQAQLAIKEHLEAAMAIVENERAYHQELAELASLCERVCHAGYTGDYKPVAVGQMPAAWVDLLEHAYYAFK